MTSSHRMSADMSNLIMLREFDIKYKYIVLKIRQ